MYLFCQIHNFFLFSLHFLKNFGGFVSLFRFCTYVHRRSLKCFCVGPDFAPAGLRTTHNYFGTTQNLPSGHQCTYYIVFYFITTQVVSITPIAVFIPGKCLFFVYINSSISIDTISHYQNENNLSSIKVPNQ